MAINKQAKNITITINDKYISHSGNLIKHAEYINIESTEENLILASNKKIQTYGEKLNKEIPKIEENVKEIEEPKIEKFTKNQFEKTTSTSIEKTKDIDLSLDKVIFSGDNKFVDNLEINAYFNNGISCFYHGNKSGSEKIVIKFKPHFIIQEKHKKDKIYIKAEIYENGILIEETDNVILEGKKKPVRNPQDGTISNDIVFANNDYFTFKKEDKIGYYNGLSIIFFVSDKKEGEFIPINKAPFEFTLYMTWAKTEKYRPWISEHMFYYACNQAKGKNKEEDIIAALWKNFKIDSKQPLGNLYMDQFNPNEPHEQFIYYKEQYPVEKYRGADALFKTYSADCIAFTCLLEGLLWINGIESKRTLIEYKQSPNNKPVSFLVKNWDFKTKNKNKIKISNIPEFEYINKYTPTDQPIDYRDEKGNYTFIANSSDVHEAAGVAGQGNPNPISDFQSHWVLNINGKYYDPSYGKSYNSFDEWKENSIAGCFIHYNGTFILIKKGSSGVIES